MTRSSKTVALALALLAPCPATRLSAQAPPPTVDTIVVVNRNIFDRSDEGTIGFITRVADALHVRTHASVIRRTLFLNQGDRYDSARAVESERALRGLGVFRQVVIDTARYGDRLGLRVETADGWSTKPQFNFAASGGDITWQAGIVEANLLGTATSLTALYTHTPDRAWGAFVYQNPHFIGRRPRLYGLYQTLSDGKRGSWSLSEPFYETAAPRAIGTTGDAADYRVLKFRDGALLESVWRHALRFAVGSGVALHRSSHGYLRLWANAAWRREDFAPLSTDPVPRSVFGTVGAGIEVARAHFLIVRGVNTYARREDLNLSHTLRLGLWAAPRAWGYPAGQAGVGAEASGQVSTTWPGGFVILRGSGAGVYASGALDSARAQGSVTIGSQNFVDQTVVVYLQGGLLRRPKPGNEFDPWLDQTGPRLFGAHVFTGTRSVWLAIEDRILVADEFGGLVGIGLAPFFDWGGAWYDDEPARTGSDVGIALRLGPTRAVRADVEEIAVGWRFGPGLTGASLALSIRRGISF